MYLFMVVVIYLEVFVGVIGFYLNVVFFMGFEVVVIVVWWNEGLDVEILKVFVFGLGL